jgi:hypothetical protein
MKKFLLAASATAALALTAAIPAATPASAASANSLCNDFADFGFPTHGECVSFINKDAIVDVCKNFLAVDPVSYEAFYGSTRLGTCVSQTRHLLKSL